MGMRRSRTLLSTVVVIIAVLEVPFTAEQAPPGNQHLNRLKSRIEEAIPLAQLSLHGGSGHVAIVEMRSPHGNEVRERCETSHAAG